jgi:TRAP transporter 4TM/12TM fusion protein
MDNRETRISSILMGSATVIAVIFCVFHLYTAGIRQLPGMEQRLIHVTLGLMMVFILSPWAKDKGPGWLDLPVVLLTLLVGGYLLINLETITWRLGNNTTLDIIAAAILILLVLESTRRLIGWPLPAIATIALAYGFFGDRIPGAFGHSGIDASRIVTHVGLTTEGIFGIPLGASASIVVIFILFAAFLNGTGAGQYFVDLVMGKFGQTRGGAAKAAVAGSALMGTLTGSVIANVMGTGTFTIPLMKENGYRAEVAGAVEAVSSTGGQIMPPVMGAAAYIIAEFLRVPFLDVMKAAIIPAILYYLAEYIFVDLEALKYGLTGLTSDEVMEYRERAKGKYYLLLPIIILVIIMVILKWLPQKAAFYSIVFVAIIGLIQKENRLNWNKVIEITKSGARSTLEVVAATACAGIVVGVLGVTGLGIQLSTILVNLAGGNLIVLLVLTMCVSLVLGTGLTTTACYIILAVLVAPSLVQMGVQPMAAHMFVFYFGCYSAITPPVALGAYVAASLAGSNPFATGFQAWRIALPGFLIPYVFTYSPAMLGMGEPIRVLMVLITACLGVWFMTISTVGFFARNETQYSFSMNPGLLV